MSINLDGSKQQQSIRIKDLCPEEKRKIGELLKKLSNETEEKEKLQNMLQEDKKLYEEKIKNLESSILQQSMMSTSNFNDLKTETCRQFSIERSNKKPDNNDNNILKNKLKQKVLNDQSNNNINVINNNSNTNVNTATLNDIRHLKERFNSMFDKIKKANEINDTIIQKVEKENEMNSILNNSDIKSANYNFKKNLNNIKNKNNSISNNYNNDFLDDKEEEPEKVLPPSPTKQDSFYNDECLYNQKNNNFDKSFLSTNEDFLNNLNSISMIKANNYNTIFHNFI